MVYFYALRDLVVWDYYDVVRKLLYPRRPPADVRDKPLFPCAHLYVVADLDGPFHQYVHPGEEVRERVLQREGDGKAAYAQCREHRGHRGAQAVEYDEAAYGEDDRLDDRPREARYGPAPG